MRQPHGSRLRAIAFALVTALVLTLAPPPPPAAAHVDDVVGQPVDLAPCPDATATEDRHAPGWHAFDGRHCRSSYPITSRNGGSGNSGAKPLLTDQQPSLAWEQVYADPLATQVPGTAVWCAKVYSSVPSGLHPGTYGGLTATKGGSGGTPYTWDHWVHEIRVGNAATQGSPVYFYPSARTHGNWTLGFATMTATEAADYNSGLRWILSAQHGPWISSTTPQVALHRVVPTSSGGLPAGVDPASLAVLTEGALAANRKEVEAGTDYRACRQNVVSSSDADWAASGHLPTGGWQYTCHVAGGCRDGGVLPATQYDQNDRNDASYVEMPGTGCGSDPYVPGQCPYGLGLPEFMLAGPFGAVGGLLPSTIRPGAIGLAVGLNAIQELAADLVKREAKSPK